MTPGRYPGISQARNFSLWPSIPKPADASTSTTDVVITEPSSLEHARTVKADSNISDFSYAPHKPTPFEPQILEDAQQAIAQPHGEVQAPPTEIALEDIPERIGYLKDICGLDFGWGPSSTVQWILEHLHISAGLSWTASIFCIGIILRTAIFPLMVRAQDYTAKMKEINVYMEPLRKQYRAAQESNDHRKMGEVAQEIRYVMQSHGMSGSGVLKSLAPIAVQIPFGFGAWRVLRNAAETPVPGFITEQWLWLHDLTFGDPYYILPAICAVFTYGTIKVGQNASSSAISASKEMQAIQPWLVRLLPGATFLFICFQPGAVQTYFMASTATGFLATGALNFGPTRRMLGLPARVPPPPETQEYTTAKTPGTSTSTPPPRPVPRQQPTTTKSTAPPRQPFITRGRSRVIEGRARNVTDSTDP